MIAEALADVAAAVRVSIAAAMPGAVITVYDHEPELAAAPCVWLRFMEARYSSARWTITLEATVAADVALGAIDAQAQLAKMTDAVLALVVPGVVPTAMTARGGGLTVRIGEAAHPCHLVTIPQLTQVC